MDTGKPLRVTGICVPIPKKSVRRVHWDVMDHIKLYPLDNYQDEVYYQSPKQMNKKPPEYSNSPLNLKDRKPTKPILRDTGKSANLLNNSIPEKVLSNYDVNINIFDDIDTDIGNLHVPTPKRNWDNYYKKESTFKPYPFKPPPPGFENVVPKLDKPSATTAYFSEMAQCRPTTNFSTFANTVLSNNLSALQLADSISLSAHEKTGLSAFEDSHGVNAITKEELINDFLNVMNSIAQLNKQFEILKKRAIFLKTLLDANNGDNQPLNQWQPLQPY